MQSCRGFGQQGERAGFACCYGGEGKNSAPLAGQHQGLLICSLERIAGGSSLTSGRKKAEAGGPVTGHRKPPC